MARIEAPSLRDYVANTPTDNSFFDRVVSVRIADINRGTSLDGWVTDLTGRSVLIATASQLTTALALIELDGARAGSPCYRQTPIPIIFRPSLPARKSIRQSSIATHLNG